MLNQLKVQIIGDIYFDAKDTPNDSFNLFINDQFVTSVDINTATNFKYLLKTFDIIKSEAKKYNTEESRLNYLSNQGVSQTLDNLANTFVMVTGYDKNYVEQMIANELSD